MIPDRGEKAVKKTYVTRMPDQSGAFLEASRIAASLGANITRVSYNKAVDVHTLFLEVSGNAQQHLALGAALEKIGYLPQKEERSRVLLVCFRLRDVPGAVTPILELIRSYRFNISYISSHEDDSLYQDFKMGLLVEDPENVREFLRSASELCEVRVVDYDGFSKVLDNTVFYLNFSNRLSELLQLNSEQKQALTLDSNRIMQMLEDRGETPYKTFETIGRFAAMLCRYKGAEFRPRVTQREMEGGARLTVIEPPCGSNTTVLESGEALLFVDSGFACYREEMLCVLDRLFPNWKTRPRALLLTHPDIDHCGLVSLFDRVYLAEEARENFLLEIGGKPNFREQKPEHAPYCRLSKLFSGYRPPREKALIPVDAPDAMPLERAGRLEFGGMELAIYRGNGGHSRGELVAVCEKMRLVFSGDIAVNVHGFTPEQAAFNQLAPYLMTGVDTLPSRAREEREALFARFPKEKYLYCPGHGALLGGIQGSEKGD